MKIQRHKLVESEDFASPFSFIPSPNVGGVLEPRFLVIHYTAGRSARESIDWFRSPDAKASAHIVIARDGTITQQVPFDRIAWHAGVSRWNDLVGLNRFSIGIELDNAGRLTKNGNSWRAWFGGSYDPSDVLEATHKNESTPAGWHLYPEAQLESTIRISRLLIAKYALQDVLGHEDISPGRKSDPGPAFPMASFKSRVLGRVEDDFPVFTTTAALNIRKGPGSDFDTLPQSPLPKGTRVQVTNSRDVWRFVDVDDAVDGLGDVQGWVHSKFLTPA